MALTNIFGSGSGGGGGGALPTFTAATANANARSIISKLGDGAVSVKDYGAVGNGSTDDTAAIQAAEDAVAAAGGTLLFPDGVYIAAGLVKRSNTFWLGASRSGTVLKLKAGATVDLITGANFATLTGGTSQSGIYNFGVLDMTLDGNKANAASGGWGLRLYGYGYRITAINVQNFAAGGVWIEYGTLFADTTLYTLSLLDDFEISNNNGIGLNINGPTDSWVTNGIIHSNKGAAEFIGGANCGGMQVDAVHVWGHQVFDTTNGWTVKHYGARCVWTNCVFEGGYAGQLLLGSNWNIFRGLQVFTAGVQPNPIGIQIGEPSHGARGNDIDASVYDCRGGALVFNSDGGFNKINLFVSQDTGTVQSGSRGQATELDIKMDTIWTGGQAGGVVIARNSYGAFTVNDGNYNDIFNINTVAGSRGFQLVNGTALAGFSDAYSTKTINLDPATAQISGVQVAAEGSLAITANGQTITPGTKGCLWLSSPLSAPITGIIISTSGVAAGQELTLLNATGQTLTFAASGSNVNGGSGISIGSGGSRKFIFDSNWFLWWAV